MPIIGRFFKGPIIYSYDTDFDRFSDITRKEPELIEGQAAS
jgi:hypothetical protein